MKDYTEGCVTALTGCLTSIIASIAIIILLCFPVMWVWNWVMPIVFGLPEVTVWQTLALLFLSRCFFKSNINISKKD